MTAPVRVNASRSDHPLRFESFGVTVQIISNEPELAAEAAEVAWTALLGNVREIGEDAPVDHVFELVRGGSRTFSCIQNGERLASGRSRKKFLHFFDSAVRVAVGEYAPDRLFLHAAAVGWHGKAVILPADSFAGKSTLVAELVRNGAEYYSDEFAIVDIEGMNHPFARPITQRITEGRYKEVQLTPGDLGGVAGSKPLPIAAIILTRYEADARWSPKRLTPGNAVLEMMQFTLAIRHRPDFSLRVLNKIASRAIIASGRRGSADKFAKTLLNFVDKHVN